MSIVMGSYPMALYCVPLLITLVGPYYMYRIRTFLALNCTLDSQNLPVLIQCTEQPSFNITLPSPCIFVNMQILQMYRGQGTSPERG